MDLVYNYLPDVYSYQSLRHSAALGYEPYDWLAENDKKAANANEKHVRKNQPCSSGKTSKDSCPICQEKQRRPLAKYIRSKSHQDRKPEESIEEEEEEISEENAAAQNVAKDLKMQSPVDKEDQDVQKK